MANTNVRAAIEPLLANLSHFTALSNRDRTMLSDSLGSEERFAAHQAICNEGDIPRSAFVMVRGMACRYRNLADGRRQILTFLLPGDFFNLNGFLLPAMCYSVVTLSPTTVITLARAAITKLFTEHPRLSAALRWCLAQDEAILHERLISLGRRNAQARVAFMFCELVSRHRAIGLTNDHSIKLPLTQLDMADALGITAVHINRVLQELRRRNLVQLDRGRLTLLDYEQLSKICDFTDDGYLQRDGVSRNNTARYLHQLIVADDEASTYLIDVATTLRQLSERAPKIAPDLRQLADELDGRVG